MKKEYIQPQTDMQIAAQMSLMLGASPTSGDYDPNQEVTAPGRKVTILYV